MISSQKIRTTCLIAASIALLSLIKISMFSEQSVAFSYSHCLSPLIGIFAGVPGAFLLFFIRSFFKFCTQFCTFSTVHAAVCACHLPTLAAALYLSILSSSQHTTHFYKKLVFALIPILCILIFCIKTYGTVACFYSVFWFIPLATLFTPHNNFYAHMLGSTFTAHAVGSVLWLFFGPAMTPEMWVGLMPIVVIERLLFASGMMISYSMVTGIISRYNALGATRHVRNKKNTASPLISSVLSKTKNVLRDEANKADAYFTTSKKA